MSCPREAQLPLLLSISEGLSRGADEMLRVSPQGDALIEELDKEPQP